VYCKSTNHMFCLRDYNTDDRRAHDRHMTARPHVSLRRKEWICTMRKVYTLSWQNDSLNYIPPNAQANNASTMPWRGKKEFNERPTRNKHIKKQNMSSNQRRAYIPSPNLKMWYCRRPQYKATVKRSTTSPSIAHLPERQIVPSWIPI
jgi:hypothetical protein